MLRTTKKHLISKLFDHISNKIVMIIQLQLSLIRSIIRQPCLYEGVSCNE